MNLQRTATRFAPLAVLAALAACATPNGPDVSSGPAAAAPQAPQQPAAEAPAVPNPSLPGIAALAYTFLDGGVEACSIIKDKGVQLAANNTTTAYAALQNGDYAYQTSSGNITLSYRISGNEVYGTQDGKQGLVPGDVGKLIYDDFTKQRATCLALIDTGIKVLSPVADGGRFQPNRTYPLAGTSFGGTFSSVSAVAITSPGAGPK